MPKAVRRIFGPGTSLLIAYSPLRGCSLLAPRPLPKSRAAPSFPIYEMASRFCGCAGRRDFWGFVRVFHGSRFKVRAGRCTWPDSSQREEYYLCILIGDSRLKVLVLGWSGVSPRLACFLMAAFCREAATGEGFPVQDYFPGGRTSRAASASCFALGSRPLKPEGSFD